jgi:NAD-dependent dihydropyrimidine dehydrogenase PreA subunit
MYVVSVDENVCNGCGACVSACPAQVFEFEGGKSVATDLECLGCMSCIAICPVEAIKVDEY